MKKIIFFTILAFTFLVTVQNCSAVGLLLDWPSIGGQKLGEQSSVPDLISYIYKFALAICGITALISIIYGAAQYAFSAGDSSKAGDAKDRITQALLGILILLFAVLILNTINPDLVNLSLSSDSSSSPVKKSCYCYNYLGEETFKQCIATNCNASCSSICSAGGVCVTDSRCP